MIQIKEITEEGNWHPEKLLPDFPFQQSFWYGEMQAMRGREVKRMEISIDGEMRALAQFVAYPLLNNKKYWYSAYGPIMKDTDAKLLKDISRECKAMLGVDGAVFVRLDFSPSLSSDISLHAQNIFTKSSKSSSLGSYFQPRNEWYTDISKSPDEILLAMHQKTRYSVRYAEKRGVTTKIVEGKMLLLHLNRFLDLMKSTAERNGFSLHDDGYYKSFFEEVVKKGNGFLIEAELEGDISDGGLASHFIVIEGNTAHYVFGASSGHHKELCAPYLAHFTGMLEAKKRGALSYNFGGISEAGDAAHYESITAFKKKFGGFVVPHGEYFDIVVKPIWYYLYIVRKFIKHILNK